MPSSSLWRFAAGPWNEGPVQKLTKGRSRVLTFDRTKATTFSFQMNDVEPQAAELEELVWDVWAWRDDPSGPNGGRGAPPLFRGRLGATQDAIDENSAVVTFNFTDYRGWLNRQLIEDADAGDVLNITPSKYAWTIVQKILAYPGLKPQIVGPFYPDSRGDVIFPTIDGILVPSARGMVDPNEAVVADFSIQGGMYGQDIIDNLAQQNLGFDWDIIPIDNQRLAFCSWGNGRGFDMNAVLKYPSRVAKVQRSFDPSNYANTIRAIGTGQSAGQTMLTPRYQAATDLATRAEGPFALSVSAMGAASDAQVDAYAQWALASHSVALPSYQLTLRPNAWGGPSDIWLGDEVMTVVRKGRLNVHEKYQVQTLQVALDENDVETVTITVGQERPDFFRRQLTNERQLQYLATR